MNTMILLLLALLPFLGFGAALPSSLHKRYYSIRPSDNQGRSLWPAVRETRLLKEPHRPVFYCFWDQSSAQNLAPLLQEAIERWDVATHPVTSLTFEPHPESGPDMLHPLKYCRELPGPVDALVISDKSFADLDEINAPVSTTGYVRENRVNFRNYMVIPKSKLPDLDNEELVVHIMHELGHVVGLAHEHQRPDRDSHIEFKCWNLRGYDRASAKIKKEGKDYAKTAHMDNDQKLDAICTDAEVAEKFGFDEVFDYLPGPARGYPFSHFEHGGDVDLDSIMIYGSYQGKDHDTPNSSGPQSASGSGPHSASGNSEGNSPVPPPTDLDPPALESADKRKLSTAVLVAIGKPEDREIVQGGSRIPKLKMLSHGDMMRVAQLYPKLGRH